jgi:hypothetical protein
MPDNVLELRRRRGRAPDEAALVDAILHRFQTRRYLAPVFPGAAPRAAEAQLMCYRACRRLHVHASIWQVFQPHPTP